MSRAELLPPGAKPLRQAQAHSRRERERSAGRRAGALVAGLLFAVAAASAVSAKDLVGVYEDALRNDPTIRAADANRLASRESRPQALAALLPQITGTAAYTRDHNSGFQDEPFNVGGQFPVVQSTAANTERQWALNLRQNLFS